MASHTKSVELDVILISPGLVGVVQTTPVVNCCVDDQADIFPLLQSQ